MPPVSPGALPVDAARRFEALYRPGTRWEELLECSPDLEAIGIRPGLPLKEARARVPGGTYLPRDAATLDAIAAAFGRVVDALDAFSPVVEPAPTAALGEGRALAYVDVAGLDLLYGPDDELAGRLAAAADEAAALVPYGEAWPAASERPGDTPAPTACAGIAAGKFTAWVAAALAGRAGGNGHVVVVPPGREVGFLAPLSLELLPLPLKAHQALQRLGVRTLGAYAALPANAVAARYGPEGKRAHLLARGLDDAPLLPRQPQPAARVELAFEWEETEMDRLTFSLKMLADQLAARLQALSADGPQPEAPDPDFADPDAYEGFDDLAHQRADETGEAGEADPGWDDDADDADDARMAVPEREGSRQGPPRRHLYPVPPMVAPAQTPDREAPQRHPPPALVVDALRVVWRLSGGREREILLRLAEPAATAAAFAEHLRWHAEGLAQFLAEEDPVAAAAPASDAGTAPQDTLTYEPIERRAGVVGVVLEAVGIQAPAASQLKLLATPLHRWGQAGAAAGADPVRRAREARRALARLQARWGPDAVQQAEPAAARLPERAFRTMAPAIGLQIGLPAPVPGQAAGSARRRAPARGGRTPTRGAQTSGAGPYPSAGTGTQAAPGGLADPAAAAGAAGDPFAPLLTQLPLWLVEPPQRIAVLKSSRPGGGPRLVELRNGVLPPGRRPGRRIVRFSPAWKLVDPTCLVERAPIERDYHQVETEDGAAYLVFRDRAADAWFLQGVFD